MLVVFHSPHFIFLVVYTLAQIQQKKKGLPPTDSCPSFCVPPLGESLLNVSHTSQDRDTGKPEGVSTNYRRSKLPKAKEQL